jgi:hypothetical protein
MPAAGIASAVLLATLGLVVHVYLFGFAVGRL